jgi:hypothetical protein
MPTLNKKTIEAFGATSTGGVVNDTVVRDMARVFRERQDDARKQRNELAETVGAEVIDTPYTEEDILTDLEVAMDHFFKSKNLLRLSRLSL